ncbi:hypothetical protein HDV00_011104 [Rhizophlyctis rosea]|nr:hypothetical protein HDV00_011104 [Rhizophlyctis rosea]
MQEHGGAGPELVNGLGLVGADGSKGKKRRKDESGREGGEGGEGNAWGTASRTGMEQEEKEFKKPKGKRKLVFVDPDDVNAPWWWPGMVVQKDDLPIFKRHVGEEGFKDPKAGEFVVCYFEDGSYSTVPETAARPLCPHLAPYTDYSNGPHRDAFVSDKAVVLATRYYERGDIPESFSWLMGVEGSQEKKIKLEKSSSVHEDGAIPGKKRTGSLQSASSTATPVANGRRASQSAGTTTASKKDAAMEPPKKKVKTDAAGNKKLPATSVTIKAKGATTPAKVPIQLNRSPLATPTKSKTGVTAKTPEPPKIHGSGLARKKAVQNGTASGSGLAVAEASATVPKERTSPKEARGGDAMSMDLGSSSDGRSSRPCVTRCSKCGREPQDGGDRRNGGGVGDVGWVERSGEGESGLVTRYLCSTCADILDEISVWSITESGWTGVRRDRPSLKPLRHLIPPSRRERLLERYQALKHLDLRPPDRTTLRSLLQLPTSLTPPPTHILPIPAPPPLPTLTTLPSSSPAPATYQSPRSYPPSIVSPPSRREVLQSEQTTTTTMTVVSPAALASASAAAAATAAAAASLLSLAGSGPDRGGDRMDVDGKGEAGLPGEGVVTTPYASPPPSASDQALGSGFGAWEGERERGGGGSDGRS